MVCGEGQLVECDNAVARPVDPDRLTIAIDGTWNGGQRASVLKTCDDIQQRALTFSVHYDVDFREQLQNSWPQTTYTWATKDHAFDILTQAGIA
jgi:hypothetical protein